MGKVRTIAGLSRDSWSCGGSGGKAGSLPEEGGQVERWPCFPFLPPSTLISATLCLNPVELVDVSTSKGSTAVIWWQNSRVETVLGSVRYVLLLIHFRDEK